MSYIQDLKNVFIEKNRGIAQVIVVNVAVFLTTGIISVLFILFNKPLGSSDYIQNMLGVPADITRLMYRPYSLFTYMFVHAGIWHLAVNMLWLNWIGSILVDLVGSKKVVACYILGGLFASLIFIAAYNVFPLFATVKGSAFLVGASGSVLAVVLAAATLTPDFSLRLLLFGDVKLKYLALVAVLLDVLQIAGSNAGGHLAHLGGAAFGFAYIRLMQQGYDLSHWVYVPVEYVKSLFAPKKMSYTVSKPQNMAAKPQPEQLNNQQQIDEILDKISAQGYENLSSAEKEKLFRLSNKN